MTQGITSPFSPLLQPMFGIVAAFTVGVPPLPVVSPGTLRMDWSVEKTADQNADTCTVTIYNLGKVMRNTIDAGLGSIDSFVRGLMRRMILSVGWGTPPVAIPQVLFVGDILRAREDKPGTDIITTFECGDGTYAMRDTPPGGGEFVAASLSLLVQMKVTSMGLIMSPATLAFVKAEADRLPGLGWTTVATDPPARQLDAIMASIKLGWGIDGGQFVVFKNGLRNDLLPSELSHRSGLLRAAPLEDGGYEFEALAQPRVVPGLQLTLTLPSGDQFLPDRILGGGPLRVERVAFQGSTQGSSLMRGIARRIALL